MLLNTRWRPSGDQLGAYTAVFDSNSGCSVPGCVEDTVKTLNGPRRFETKARRPPSDDHPPPPSDPGSNVSRVGTPRAKSTIHTSRFGGDPVSIATARRRSSGLSDRLLYTPGSRTLPSSLPLRSRQVSSVVGVPAPWR